PRPISTPTPQRQAASRRSADRRRSVLRRPRKPGSPPPPSTRMPSKRPPLSGTTVPKGQSPAIIERQRLHCHPGPCAQDPCCSAAALMLRSELLPRGRVDPRDKPEDDKEEPHGTPSRFPLWEASGIPREVA